MKNRGLTSGLVASLVLAWLTAGCQKTGQLSPDLQIRFDKEGIVHRADDFTFRRTRPAGQRDSGWDEKRASIIVTRKSVFLHVNGKPFVEITHAPLVSTKSIATAIELVCTPGAGNPL